MIFTATDEEYYSTYSYNRFWKAAQLIT